MFPTVPINPNCPLTGNGTEVCLGYISKQHPPAISFTPRSRLMLLPTSSTGLTMFSLQLKYFQKQKASGFLVLLVAWFSTSGLAAYGRVKPYVSFFNTAYNNESSL